MKEYHIGHALIESYRLGGERLSCRLVERVLKSAAKSRPKPKPRPTPRASPTPTPRQQSRLLVEAYKIGGESRSTFLLDHWMESNDPHGGEFKKGGGRVAGGTPDAKPSVKAKTPYAKLAAKQPRAETKAMRPLCER